MKSFVETIVYIFPKRQTLNYLPCTKKRIIYALAVVLINRLSYLNHLNYSAYTLETKEVITGRARVLHSTLVDSDSYLSQISNEYPQRFRFGQAGAGPRMV